MDACSSVGNNESRTGMAAQTPCAIDQYAWGRNALTFCRMSVDEFESLTGRIGWDAAGEVLLLAVAQKCGDKLEKWSRAAALGIPWRMKRWSSMNKLQLSYNAAVHRSILQQMQGSATSAGISSEHVWWDISGSETSMNDEQG